MLVCFLFPYCVGSKFSDISWTTILTVFISWTLLKDNRADMGHSISMFRTGYTFGMGVMIARVE